jgi:hypothetical protein
MMAEPAKAVDHKQQTGHAENNRITTQKISAEDDAVDDHHAKDDGRRCAIQRLDHA